MWNPGGVMSEVLLQDLFGLEGKVVAVTGGGGVLCGALSRALGGLGAKVAVLDLFVEAAERVVDEIVSAGGEAIAVKCDVLDRISVERAAQTIVGTPYSAPVSPLGLAGMRTAPRVLR